jgi:hypothetical protein
MSEAIITKSQQWKERIEQWQISGKSITSWCRDNKIPYNTFQYWRKRLGLMAGRRENKTSSFIEIQDTSPSFSGIELQIKGISLHLYREFDETTLIRCLSLLRGS